MQYRVQVPRQCRRQRPRGLREASRTRCRRITRQTSEAHLTSATASFRHCRHLHSGAQGTRPADVAVRGVRVRGLLGSSSWPGRSLELLWMNPPSLPSRAESVAGRLWKS
jgi:hypothetical protein